MHKAPPTPPEKLAMGLSARDPWPCRATQGRALGTLSSAIRGEEENWSWVGGPLGGRLNSTSQPGLEPDLQDVSLLPPSGEPGKMTLGRAAQAGFERRGGVSIPIPRASTMCQACYLIISPSLFFKFRGRRSEVKELTRQHCCVRACALSPIGLLCAWCLVGIRPMTLGRCSWSTLSNAPWKAA